MACTLMTLLLMYANTTMQVVYHSSEDIGSACLLSLIVTDLSNKFRLWHTAANKQVNIGNAALTK